MSLWVSTKKSGLWAESLEDLLSLAAKQKPCKKQDEGLLMKWDVFPGARQRLKMQ